MGDMTRSRLLASPLLAVLFGLVALLASCGGEDDAAAGLEGITRDAPLRVGHVVVPEVDESGRESDYAFRAEPGGLLFVYFGYTRCPDLCPTTFADFKAALARLGPDRAERVEAAFVTVDPDRDTPDIVVGYLGHFVERGHAVRIADHDRLAEAEAAFGASSTITTHDDGTVEVSHTAIAYVVDDEGNVVVEWPFGTSPTAMAHDLQLLLDQPEEAR
jgi:cytochrome oxidase Cu insertion factor (SCO1/SenC/PrrC family)